MFVSALRFSLSFLLVVSFLSSQVFHEPVFLLAPSSRVQSHTESPPVNLKKLLGTWATAPYRLPGEIFASDFPVNVGIGGVGIRMPSRHVPNRELPAWADAVREEVTKRLEVLGKRYRAESHFDSKAVEKFKGKGTGIQARYIFDPSKDNPPKLAAEALMDALTQFGIPIEAITPEMLPWLISVTTYPADLASPGLGPLVHQYLNRFPFPAFSGDAVCPGWIAAIIQLLPHMGSGIARLGLIPVVEYYSRRLRPDSHSTFPIFGDMAAGTILAPAKKGYGILWGLYQTYGGKVHLSAPDREGKPIGELMASEVIKTPNEGFFDMHGQAVGAMAVLTGTFAVRRAETILKQLKLGQSRNDIRWYVFHQANKRLVLELATLLEIPHEKLLFTMEDYGNTAAASIPLTLWVHRDKIKPGQLVFLGTYGGGFQWGALLVRWGGTDPALLTSLTPEYFHTIDEAI